MIIWPLPIAVRFKADVQMSRISDEVTVTREVLGHSQLDLSFSAVVLLVTGAACDNEVSLEFRENQTGHFSAHKQRKKGLKTIQG